VEKSSGVAETTKINLTRVVVSSRLDLKIAKLEKNNTKLKNELGKTRFWNKMSMIFGLFWFGVCLVLGTILLCRNSGNWSHVYLK